MPMLGKKPFMREKPPKDLRLDEELFYCRTTHEVFREYEKFFDRVILCNSLVWTCCVTGRCGLTYSEAIESEMNARRTLKKFPRSLQRPILYLASLTNRSRLNDLCDDVFNFVKDRYFVGETVEVNVNGIKKRCDIKKVIIPEKVEKEPKSETKKTPVKNVSPDKIKYEVEEKETKRKLTVKSQCISRPKTTYTKPQNKLFIKHHSEPESGIWKLKEKSVQKFNLDSFQLNTVYPGVLPKYATPTPIKKKSPKTDSSGKKTVQGKLNFKKENGEEKHKNAAREQEEFIKQRLKSEEERQKRKEEQRKKIEDEKEKLKEQRLKDREQKKEEKRKHAEYLMTWRKPRDDLECDDLLDLPKPTPVECNIPQECFGDTLMVLEFLDVFKTQINLKDSFRQGFTFENLEKALFETDIQGIFSDLLQLLLTAVFQLQDWEDEKLTESERKNFKHISEFKDFKSNTLDEATDIATAAAAWPQLYHGTLLDNVPLDSFSLTEVLRLHILASGSESNRMAQMGLTGLSEDPGLYFKTDEPDLVKKLSTTSVFQLSCEERLKILSLLTNQLAFSSTVRNLIDENLTKSRPLKYELKSLRWAYVRQTKENTLINFKKKLDKSLDDSQKSEKNEVEKTEEEKENKTEEEKENIDNMTQREKAIIEEKFQKEEAKRKSDFLRKEKDLINQIEKLQSSYQVIPLGRDRAYRRFWTFRSMSGIFVEDDDKYVGRCLSKETPQVLPNPSIKKDNSVNTIRKYLQQLDSPKNGSSDKENDILQDLAIIQSDIPMPFKDRKLCDLNSRVDTKRAEGDCSLCKEKMVEFENNIPRYCPHEKNSAIFGLCTANIETCPVHNIHAPRTKWSFYHREEDLDSLLLALNIRGFREGPLREAILSEKEAIAESMAKCQSSILNKHLPPTPQLERKSQRLQGTRKSEFANMKPREALELTLRDMILEFEHRIYAGGLGYLRVSDRVAWRQAIEQSSYDMQCEELHLGSKTVSLTNGVKENNSEERIVHHLACALLQLSQGIETKFLNPPLGDTDHFKDKKDKALKNISAWESKQKSKESENEPDPGPCPKLPESSLYRWQISLMECTSFSQLFVHLGTLERSVAWSRSVLKAHCRICRRRGDGENMLLCDGCNRGHHLYCLKPPLEEIPQGDWFCLSCKPPEKSTPQKKKVEVLESESESEESDDEEEDYEESEKEDSSDEAEEPEVEVCKECGVGGTVICCDGCPAVYHPECVELRRIPRGEWLCPVCTKKEEALKKSQKHSPTGSYSTRAQSLFSNQKKEKEKSRTLRTRIQIKKPGSKRQKPDSSDSDWSSPPPSSKRSRSEKKRESNGTAEKDNPFKKIYRDSALNTARRRSKSMVGGENLLDYKTCYDLVLELTRHPSSWPFLAPVNKKDAPNYHNVIKRPMDFGTIKSKLNNMRYANNEDFVLDLFLIIQNCQVFNPRDSKECKASRVMHKEIKRLLDESTLSKCVPSKVRNNLTDNVFI